jgi:DNA-binding NarL/FixJ family response regulator
LLIQSKLDTALAVVWYGETKIMIGMRTRVLLVDDHPLFREGLAALIRTAPDLEVVGEAGDLEDVRSITARERIEVALVDVLIPTTSGMVVTRELRVRQPMCRILGLSVVEEPHVIAEMLRAGATGFALKTEPAAAIMSAIRDTANGVRYLPASIPEDVIDRELEAGSRSLDADLTKRELEIFDLIIRGYSNSEIGKQLFIARRTVETHRHRIAKKLNARSIVEMQRLAARVVGVRS